MSARGPSAARRDELLRLFHGAGHIGETFGMQLSFEEDGTAVVTLPHNPRLDHAYGAIHGGIYATLLDTAGWFASAVARSDAPWIATSELSIHFLKAARRTALRAEGRILKAGKRQDVVEMKLFDGRGELVGHAVGTFMVLPGARATPGSAGKEEKP